MFSPEDKEASRRRLKEVQRAYHHHAQDLVESFHSSCKSSRLEEIDAKKQLLRARAQEEEERAAAAKGYAETTAAALEEQMAKKQTPKKAAKAPKSPSAEPRFMWRKTILLVQRENAAREARRERESKKAIKGFGSGTLQ